MSALATTIRGYLREGTEVGRFLRDHHHSEEFRDFAVRYSTLNQLWINCDRADWMLMMLQSIDLTPEFALRKFAGFCAYQCSHLMNDPRSLHMLALLERYVKREVNWLEVVNARMEAYVAVNAAALRNDALGEALASTAASAAKNDAFTAAYDTCHHALRAVELGTNNAPELQRLQAVRLRSLFGNPFNSRRF